MREIFEEFRNPIDIIHLSDEDIGRRYIASLKKRRSAPFNSGRPSFLVYNELLAADEVLRPTSSAPTNSSLRKEPA